VLFFCLWGIKLTNKTEIQKWSELYSKEVSSREYDEICHNLSGFFSLVKNWDDKERVKTGNVHTNSIGNTDNAY